MSSNIMRAAVVQPDKTIKVERRPIPTPGFSQILLKVIAVGQNPADWMEAEYFSEPGAIIGCDAVGEVVKLGADVPRDQVQVGELRSVFVRGGTSPTHGAFAEYVAFDWDLTSIVPNNITPEQAASTPCPLATAVQALYLTLELPEPIQPPPGADSPWILIWSGGTAVGQYTIQLAKLSGLNVITTASPKRFESLKAMGADIVLDYRDTDVVERLKEATGDRIAYGLDCFSHTDSLSKTQLAFRPSGGRLVVLMWGISGLPRTDVKTSAICAYTAFGKDAHFGTDVIIRSAPSHREIHVKYQKRTTELFRAGQLKPLDVKVLGGLDAVQSGFDLLKGKKNDTKIVLRVREQTPSESTSRTLEWVQSSCNP